MLKVLVLALSTFCLKPSSGTGVAAALSGAGINMTGGGRGVAPGDVRRARSVLRRRGYTAWARGLNAEGRFT